MGGLSILRKYKVIYIGAGYTKAHLERNFIDMSFLV